MNNTHTAAARKELTADQGMTRCFGTSSTGEQHADGSLVVSDNGSATWHAPTGTVIGEAFRTGQTTFDVVAFGSGEVFSGMFAR